MVNSLVAQMISRPGKVADTAGTDDQELTVLGEFPEDQRLRLSHFKGHRFSPWMELRSLTACGQKIKNNRKDSLVSTHM